jgi:hypothetical protein
VRERLIVLYGDTAQVELESQPGRGTKVRLVMPLTHDEGSDGLLVMLTEAVESQRERFAKIGTVGRHDG